VGSFNVPLRDELVALLVIGHPMNGVAFRACVEQHLVPTLPPGDIVPADSLQCHKSPSVRAAAAHGSCASNSSRRISSGLHRRRRRLGGGRIP
jgi:hypothetical protein